MQLGDNDNCSKTALITIATFWPVYPAIMREVGNDLGVCKRFQMRLQITVTRHPTILYLFNGLKEIYWEMFMHQPTTTTDDYL
jgi:hypothetical protein